MDIVFFGNGPRGSRCLDELIGRGDAVRAVVGHTPQSDLVVKGREYGLPVYHPPKVNAPAFVAELRNLAPDLFILAGYNQILRKPLIGVPSRGVLNLHGGKLPEYRGVAPINWQIINGESIGGCCIIFVDPGIDTGDIVEQEYFRIEENETAGDIIDKQLVLFPRMLVKALDDIENGCVERVPQDPGKGRYFTRRYPKDSRADWRSSSARQVHNLIRAMQGPSYPPAFSFYKGEKCLLLSSRILDEDIRGTPGRIALKRRNGVVVIGRDRGLLLTRVALAAEGIGRPSSQLLETGEDLE